jgi:hypothetical protein
MRVIFDAGPQRWKIWFVVLITLACGVALLLMSAYWLRSYGLGPMEGGVLKPLGVRVWGALAWAAPGVAFIAGIVAYVQCYVTRIEVDDDAGAYRVAVAGFGPGLQFGMDRVARTGFNDGISHAGGMSVNAPWYSVRLRGRRLPLIVDLQGDFLDERAVYRLVEGKPAPALHP